MSAWSGIAGAAVGLVLALAAIGQPIWEWRVSSPTGTDTWSYYAFDVRHVVTNSTTGNTTTEAYAYGAVAGQDQLSAVFRSLGQTLLFSFVAVFAGAGLSGVTAARKLRGIFGGIAFLAGCLLTFYLALDLVIAIPPAASDLGASIGQPVPDFKGQVLLTQAGGNTIVSWGPSTAWYLFLGIGIAYAFAASEVWHLRARKKAAAPSSKVAGKAAEELPPPPPVVVLQDAPQEPEIEEIFVIAPSGLLVKHMSRSLMSDKDRDVVGGMISVVSNFVQDAFSERNGEVHEVTLGRNRFVLCRDGGVVVAVLVGRGSKEDIMHRLRHLLACLLDRYGERLTHWDGKALEGIEDEIQVLWEPFFIPPPPAD